MLNLEAVFTAFLAWLLYREPIGPRVTIAMLLMLLGGALVAGGAGGGAASLLGILAVIAATASWAADNALSRELAEADPLDIVLAKGGLGAATTGSIAILVGESAPSAGAALALLALGASGYGLSLRLYLLAQSRIGAARTGSVFATGPFLGAALAWLLGDRGGSATWLAASAFVAGVVLHATRAARPPARTRGARTHNHAHNHGEGRHDHQPQVAVEAEHTHAHQHGRAEHDHEHAPICSTVTDTANRLRGRRPPVRASHGRHRV